MNADLAGLSAVSDNLAFGTATLSVATSASSQISSQLSSLKNTIVQAQQNGIDPTTMGNQITSILSNINQFASSATFNGVNLLDGTSPSLNVVQDIKGTQLTVANQAMTATGLGLTGLGVNSSAVNLAFDNTFAAAQGDTVSLSDGTNSWTFEINDTSSPAALASVPSATNKVTAVNVDLSTASSNQVVGALVAAMKSQGFGAEIQTDGSVNVGGNGITNASSTTTIGSGGATQTAITGAAAAITLVDSAITSMNSKTATLGQAQQQIAGMSSFTSSLSSSLTAGLGALTDADMAAESAKLQSLQTKQSLAVQALSIANQQPQSLMSLFR